MVKHIELAAIAAVEGINKRKRNNNNNNSNINVNGAANTAANAGANNNFTPNEKRSKSARFTSDQLASMKQVPCRFFNSPEGKCHHGDKCRFAHTMTNQATKFVKIENKKA